MDYAVVEWNDYNKYVHDACGPYNTFSQAKKELLKAMRQNKADWSCAVRQAEEITINQVEK